MGLTLYLIQKNIVVNKISGNELSIRNFKFHAKEKTEVARYVYLKILIFKKVLSRRISIFISMTFFFKAFYFSKMSLEKLCILVEVIYSGFESQYAITLINVPLKKVAYSRK